jgi:hypothetical protein
MDKASAVSALREAANRLEQSGYAGDEISVKVDIHWIKDRNTLADLLRMADAGTIQQGSHNGSHWARFDVDDAEFTAFFVPGVLGVKSHQERIVTTATGESVHDLLAECLEASDGR